jgi:hypothetical protein
MKAAMEAHSDFITVLTLSRWGTHSILDFLQGARAMCTTKDEVEEIDFLFNIAIYVFIH